MLISEKKTSLNYVLLDITKALKCNLKPMHFIVTIYIVLLLR